MVKYAIIVILIIVIKKVNKNRRLHFKYWWLFKLITRISINRVQKLNVIFGISKEITNIMF